MIVGEVVLCGPMWLVEDIEEQNGVLFDLSKNFSLFNKIGLHDRYLYVSFLKLLTWNYDIIKPKNWWIRLDSIFSKDRIESTELYSTKSNTFNWSITACDTLNQSLSTLLHSVTVPCINHFNQYDWFPKVQICSFERFICWTALFGWNEWSFYSLYKCIFILFTLHSH